MSADDEAARIRAEYARREQSGDREFYALTRPANLFARHGQERALLRGLERAGALPLGDRTILEVGCGRGQWLGVFEDFAARRDRIAGIDLDAARIAEAVARYPGADLRVGDATALPWPTHSFDVVFQSTMMTSILDANVRRAVAAELRRVVRPTGAIVWYDFRFDNPKNRAVRGIRHGELRALFPGCAVEIESATLAPPIARRLVPHSWMAASVLERLGVLNTHCLAVIKPLS